MMRQLSALITLLLASQLVFADAHGHATMSAAERVSTHLERTDRAKDAAQDAGRRPVELVEFVGITPGMTILDVGAGPGYATEIFSAAVGPEGKVYSQNSDFANKLMDGQYTAPLYQRTANKRLPNVDIIVVETDAIPLEGVIDVAFWGTNLHDYYNRSPEAAAAVLSGLYKTLKPGGLIAITDHVGIDEATNAALHRMSPEAIEQALKAAGFTDLRESQLYRNSTDDHQLNVFDPGIRGRTDRVFFIATRPAE